MAAVVFPLPGPVFTMMRPRRTSDIEADFLMLPGGWRYGLPKAAIHVLLEMNRCNMLVKLLLELLRAGIATGALQHILSVPFDCETRRAGRALCLDRNRATQPLCDSQEGFFHGAHRFR